MNRPFSNDRAERCSGRAWIVRGALAGVLALSASCASLFRPERGAVPEGRLPTAFTLYASDEKFEAPLWEAQAAPELAGLIEQALAGNFSLQEARARLEQVEAVARRAGSALTPTLDGSAGAERTEQHRETSESSALTSSGVPAATGTTRTERYALGLAASYELDLWGRVRSGRAAARLDAEAAREDVRAAEITIAALVSQRWIELRSQREQVALLHRQLETNRALLELVELRFRNSLATALAVLQQRRTVAGVEAALPSAEAQERLLIHELALLLGRAPSDAPSVGSGALPAPGALPETGLPADLLAARPDLRAAGSRLQAADWLVGAARADRLPALRLTAQATYSGERVGSLFDNWLLHLAGSLTGPLVDGGRRRAEVDRVRAVAAERLQTYRKTVITAVKEVEDALVQEDRQRARMERLEAQLATARQALGEARTRYLNGVNDFLPVLTEELAVQQLERDRLQARANQWIYRIALHRALGGAGVRYVDDLRPAKPEMKDDDHE